MLRKSLAQACRASFLFWVNAFAWTYRQKMVDAKGNEIPVTGAKANVPFITWPVQDEAAEAMQAAISEGTDVNLEKSRDMGASWLVLALADWFMLWHSEVSVGCVSRRENLVDQAGNMDTLFEKIRYINRMLPSWQVPRIRDTYMFLHNLENNSSISGESTTSEVGRGGRKTFYLVDEAAVIRHGEDVESSLSQNCPCQIWASTPRGPNTHFHKRIKESRGVTIRLPWYRHPEKAKGAYQEIDELGRIQWTSAWKQKQDAMYSRRTVAQEIEMDHGQAGDMFFDHAEVERHRRDHQTEPILRGELVWNTALPEQEQIELLQQMDHTALSFIRRGGRSPWRFWIELADGRPPQHWTYVYGVDISNGAGDSNSVISVMAVEIGQIVAKFWDAYTSPEALAVVAAMSGVWFGGIRPPAFIAWENNGPGGIFGRKLVSMGYPSYYRQRIDNTVKNKKTPRWGWHSNNERKEVLLGMYRDALSRDDLINPCRESLDECEDYIYDDSGSILPGILREESSGGRSLHGDHVIADALTWLARQELGAQRDMPRKAPMGTYGWRRRRRQRQSEIERRSPWPL